VWGASAVVFAEFEMGEKQGGASPAPTGGVAWHRHACYRHTSVKIHGMNRHSLVSTIRCSSLLFLILALNEGRSAVQQTEPTVNIQVHADQSDGPLPRIWNYFGYDEPNYTYAPNGKKLLGELAALSSVPVHIRVHNLLTSGDGSASLKWGSTNVYTEDAQGNAIYSWAILDRIFDTYLALRIKPLVQVGFMPEALSTHPQPYRHNFPHGTIFTGWAYPPKDYQKWADLVFHFAAHLCDRYGEAEAKTWLWEIWNEPDIDYWKGTPEEYFKLYDFSAAAILRALPGASVGGPDTTGPASPRAAEFLRRFLEHCAHEQNFATGKIGSPLAFISFHPKGATEWDEDHVQMGVARQLASIEQGFKIVESFPAWKDTPIILGESDPEGCAACTARTYPQNAYRNGAQFASYTAEVLNTIHELARREQINFAGAVTWSFEFEDQPYFEGYRALATNGLDKPVLNVFRMFGLLGTGRVKSSSSSAIPAEEVLRAGVRGQPDINAIATGKDHEIEILIWNYHDADLSVDAAKIELSVEGLPANVSQALLEHFRIDADHSNAFTAWKEMGSPQAPSDRQYEQLESAGQLQLLESPSFLAIESGTAHLRFSLPRQGLSLIRIGWQ
jgi:xylan 1,4-beta-xylosidase